MIRLKSIKPVILAGGKGTRLWPITSEKRPKPFLKLMAKHSLFQQTLTRVKSFGAPIIVSEKPYTSFIEKDCGDIAIQPERIIYEQEGRNTGPAICAASYMLKDQNPLMLVLPCDHFIDNQDGFRRDVIHAATEHKPGSITLFGIQPRFANSHYGYICPNPKHLKNDGKIKKVQRFVEKPDRKQAMRLIENEHALWHSGMFLAYARDLDMFIKMSDIRLWRMVSKSFEGFDARRKGDVLLGAPYMEAPSISIDYLILERINACFVKKIDVYWNDIGTLQNLTMGVLKGQCES